MRLPALLLSAVALVPAACAQQEGVRSAEVQAEVVTITAEELAARIAAGTVTLVDVRTDEEIAEGMIEGAMHMPIADFDPAALDGIDDVVLYCRSSGRSGRAARMLADHRGERVEHLEGGILAWLEAGYPVVAPSE